MTPSWTTVDDLVGTLRKRWGRGIYLRDYASGEPWQPVVLPVRAPTPTELRDHFDDVRKWAERFRRDTETTAGRPRFATESRTVRGKGLGANELPARIRLETFDECCALLGTTADVRALDAIIELTESEAPALLPWVRRNPPAAIVHAEHWPRLIQTVNWIAGHDTSTLYLRHLDVPGVDTKFVERHQKIVGQLLVEALPPALVDLAQPDFVRWFGFRPKPDYTRLRVLCDVAMFPPGITELRLRTDELARLDVPVATVFVVENEVSYLAFPELPDALVVFGEGFHLSSLDALPWLHRKEIVYWGDIDTHGFAILNRLRERFCSVQSILMDHATLLEHAGQYVTEPSPTAEPLPALTEHERAVYNDLIEDRFGHAVRLEQERVRFSLVRQVLEPWRERPARDR